MRGSIYNRIKNQVEKSPGSLIIAEDFNELESYSGVITALGRLVKAGKLERITHGIYYSPKIDPVIGKILPSVDDLVYKIAERDKVKILPTGATALNQLGLSNQVPLKQIYLTDGNPKVLHIGKSIVQFKRTSPRQMHYKGKLSSLIVLALKDLGPKNVNNDIITRIADLLNKELPSNIEHDMSLAPLWIKKLLRPLIQNPSSK
ncbi:MAG TPA: DUF6088 family protein [Patescibacteria group bacterium]